jgi:predicted transcriptional regulator
MKDAVITVRVPLETRRRLERLARREGRSLSQQIERLIDQSLTATVRGVASRTRGSRRSLAGALAGGRVPTWDELKQVRRELSAALLDRAECGDQPRR